MYHALRKAGTYDAEGMDRADSRYLVEASLLQQHIRAFHEAGWQTAPWGEHARMGADGEDVVPHCGTDEYLLTFDDSWASHYSVAVPLLQEENCAGVFFLTVNQLGRTGMLQEDEVRAMHRAGAGIGSHGMTHRHFDTLSRSELQAELSDSRKALCDMTGSDIRLLALPGGKSHRRLLEASQVAGYRQIFTSRPGLWRPGQVMIPRLSVTADFCGPTLGRLLENPLAFCSRKCIRYRMLLLLRSVLGAYGYRYFRSLLLRDKPTDGRHDSNHEG
jgi:peptidoglycan/xylan/chitin deacetylase (PgdA/CDA1 family)